MPEKLAEVDVDLIAARLERIEERLAALERWQHREEAGPAPVRPERVAVPARTAPAPEARPVQAQAVPGDDEFEVDLSLIGRTLIVFGGAYLLRAVTESAILPASLGVGVGLLYALIWSILALRPGVGRQSAAHHTVATTFTALPLIFEATRRFQVFEAWSSAVALLAVSAVVITVASRRNLQSLAWTFTLAALMLVPILMAVTSAVAPFALYLAALGVAAVWLGYVYEWVLLRWVVAVPANLVLVLLAFLVVTNRLPSTSPALAIGVIGLTFCAYIGTFAVRTLVRGREVLPFEIAQTCMLLATGLGSAMWIAANKSTLELPLAVAMLGLAAASYAVSFAFIPRHFSRPANFVFYSSLALMLVIAGGVFVVRGLPNSILWATLALASAYLAGHYRKSSLALHAAVYLFAGFVGAGVIELGLRAFFLRVEQGWTVPSPGALLLLVACALVASVRPIERQGSFQLWAAAKGMAIAELGWLAAALVMTAVGLLLMNEGQPDAGVLAAARTAVLAALTVLTAWCARFPLLSPARTVSDAAMGLLVVKLMWEDFRLGSAATLFVSLAIVGVALILASRLRRRGAAPMPAPVEIGPVA